MKNSILLALTTALALVITTGCRNNGVKTTPLPTAGTTSDEGTRKLPNLDTAGLGNNGNPNGSGITSTSVPSDIPDVDKLKDRDTDRARFASETVLFAYDRAEVGASEAAKAKRVADAFKKLPAGHDLLIEGHCDERGTEGYNQALGERRALALRELLVQSGIDGQHVFTKSFGKDKPAVVGHDEAAWSKNRRGEFILVLPKKMTTTQNSQ